LFSIIWSLSIAVGIIMYGRLSDQFGRKPFTIGGLLLGTIGCE
jgi:MFS family permease